MKHTTDWSLICDSRVGPRKHARLLPTATVLPRWLLQLGLKSVGPWIETESSKLFVRRFFLILTTRIMSC